VAFDILLDMACGHEVCEVAAEVKHNITCDMRVVFEHC